MLKKKILLLIAAITSVIVGGFAPAQAAGEVVNVTESTFTIHVGEPITFTVTSNTSLTPAGKITYRTAGGQTLNVANDTAFVHGSDGNGGNTFTYTPRVGEAGRLEVFSGTIYVPASGHLVRPVSGSISFLVVPLDPTPSAYNLGPSYFAYSIAGGQGGAAYSSGCCTNVVAIAVIVGCINGSGVITHHYGNRVYVAYDPSQYICPSGTSRVGSIAIQYYT